MKKVALPKEEYSPLHGNHHNSASSTEAATLIAPMAATHSSRIGAINKLGTMAEQLQTYAVRTSISIITPAKPRP